MTRRSAVSALAEVTSALVDTYDVVSALTALARSCVDVFGAGASGILLVGSVDPRHTSADSPAPLELLAASSHEAGELEMFQAQVHEGPCLDAVGQNAIVSVTTAVEMVRRWPRMGVAIEAGGYHSAHAFPMLWRGLPLGAVNIFLVDERELAPEDVAAGRAFADVATIAIVHARSMTDPTRLMRDIQQALDGRIVVEQAKGVLAVQEGVDPGTAFGLLAERSRDEGVALAELAAQVMESAQRGERWASWR